MIATSAEAQLHRIFNLCKTLEELSKHADENKYERRVIKLLLKRRPYRLERHDQVRDCILAVVTAVAAGMKENSPPPTADNVLPYIA